MNCDNIVIIVGHTAILERVSMNQYVVHLPISFKGWIMEGIARDSAAAIGIQPRFRFFAERKRDYLKLKVLLGLFDYKKSSVHIFMHHRTYWKFANQVVGKRHLFLTHIDHPGDLTLERWRGFVLPDCVITQNSQTAGLAQNIGVDMAKILIGYGGVSRSQYFPVSRLGLQAPFVLIVGDCKPRKNPEFLKEVIIGLPNINFVIHGTGWLNYIFSDEGIPKNLKIFEFRQGENPRLMREASVLLSVATKEGGPFPVLEALASGTPVVATPTGFCSEMVTTGRGVLLSSTPEISDVQKAIMEAFSLKAKVATKDLLDGQLKWDEFGFKLYFGRGKSV